MNLTFDLILDLCRYGMIFLMSLLCGILNPFKGYVKNLLLFMLLGGLQYVIIIYLFEVDFRIPLLFSCAVFIVDSIIHFVKGSTSEAKKEKAKEYISLPVLKGTRHKQLEFYYPYANFLVYGGAGSGKTKSIGKWLLDEYIKMGFAGFIYDFKDIDYTQTAYNLMKKHGYKNKFYYVNFDNLNRSYRFNPLKVVKDKTELMQLMEDMLLSLQSKDAKQDEWFFGGLGILRGVAFRFWNDFNEYCTIPHILTAIMSSSQIELTIFLDAHPDSATMASAFLKARDSEKTQASYLSTLCNQLAVIAADENVAWVLSGDDFDFNLIDPKDPKFFAVSNNFSKNSVYSPVIGMLISISSRKFTMQNIVPFVYFLDEMTTVKVKNFETLPSVLREYKAAFVLLTQSGAKLENLYGKLDRSSIEANFGNMFLGRTKDVEALKYYPNFFGKEEKERRSRSTGKSGASSNSSVTISSQKEDVYQGKDFSELEPGEFIGSATRANVKDFKVQFRMFEIKEEELPEIAAVTAEDVYNNYMKIYQEVADIIKIDEPVEDIEKES